MRGFIGLLLAFSSVAVGQQISFKPGTGTRSLWIPFKTVSGTPLASIAGNDADAQVTTYVISCPTDQPQCAIAPNMTLTEGVSTAKYTTTNSVGTAVLRCDLSGPTSAVCSNYASGGGQISKGKPSTLSPNQIVYQAVEVTSTMNNTSTMPQTVTVTAQHTTTTSTTSSSTAGATATGGPWAMGGALGAGLLALAAM